MHFHISQTARIICPSNFIFRVGFSSARSIQFYIGIILSYLIKRDLTDNFQLIIREFCQFSQNFFAWNFLSSLRFSLVCLASPKIFFQDWPFRFFRSHDLSYVDSLGSTMRICVPRWFLSSRDCSRSASHGGEGGVGPTGVRSRVALKGEPNARARFSSADISNAATYPAGRSAPRQGDARASLEIHPLVREWVQARQGRRAASCERIARIAYLSLGSRSPANRRDSSYSTAYLGFFPTIHDAPSLPRSFRETARTWLLSELSDSQTIRRRNLSWSFSSAVQIKSLSSS